MRESLLNIRDSIPTGPVGQVVFESDASWIVPDGVFSISAVGIGAGGRAIRGSTNTMPGGSGGGGLSWRNNIPVTPGETLTINIGNGNTPNRDTSLHRDSTILLIARCGGTNNNNMGGKGGFGGKDSHAINDGGGNGGDGGNGSSRSYGGGGGAGGYTGNGGRGGHGPAINGLGNNGFSGSGGGAGGGSSAGGSSSGSGGMGGATGLFGRGSNGSGGVSTSSSSSGSSGGHGSRGQTRRYGNGDGNTNAGGIGGLRIIWGADRYFPDTNTQDIV